MPITTNVVSSNPVQSRCTQYNIMWSSLSVTCCHDITKILLKVVLNTITLTLNYWKDHVMGVAYESDVHIMHNQLQ